MPHTLRKFVWGETTVKHSILLIGQSNMAGRGYTNEVLPMINKRLFILRNGLWRPMYVPVNPDRVTSGINLSESFADLYARDHDVQVGIIPCADGGSSLDQWAEGSILFDHACYMAELASRTSNIVAVLWHQGESDSSADKAPLYEEKLRFILSAFRKRLGLEHAPFLLGGLGDFLVQNPDPVRCEKFQDYDKVNQALQRIATKEKAVGFVSAEGLVHNGDYLHFSAQSLRTFGERYYEAFLQLEDKEYAFEERTTADAGIKTGLENL